MFLSSLELTDFRNYEQLVFGCSSQKNIFYGENAQGKTNILEAIFLLCFSRSFKSFTESEIVSFNKSQTSIVGHFENDVKIKRDVALHYIKGEGKKIFVDGKKINRYSELIGQFPIVLLAPEDFKITIGNPAERRKFADTLLSQISNTYLKTLQQYVRVLKQRNKLLSKAAVDGYLDEAFLVPWDENLVKFGSAIIKFRHIFVSEFSPLLSKIYMDLNLSNESVTFSYKPSFKFNEIEEIEVFFAAELKQKRRLERLRGMTVCGPHRDDFSFKINNKELRRFGSRGQHKTALVALKMTEYYYLKRKIEETPIALFDDLFSDLDPGREERIIEKIQDLGQIFITTTRPVSSQFIAEINSRQYKVVDNNVIIVEN